MSNKVRRVFFTVLVVFIIVLWIIMGLIFNPHNYQSSDVKAIDGSYYFSVSSESDVLYKYENSKSEICVFSSSDEKFCIAFLKKINLFGLEFYKYEDGTDYFRNTYGSEYIKAGDDLYYIFLTNDGRIKNIDSCGYTPEEKHISYVDGKNEMNYGWIYVVDTENNTSDQEFTNYRKTEGDFY